MPRKKTGFYSNEAHIERLKTILKWAEENEELQRCLKRKALKKAARLIREESIERFGIGTRHANEYAKIVLARLKIRKEIYTKWGFI